MNEKFTAKQNERIARVMEKMKENGLEQLLISDPKSIAFLTGIFVDPYERLWALLLKSNGEHVFFMNTLFFVSETGYKEVWFTDMDDQIGLIMENIDKEGTLGIDKTWAARFLIPLQERCPNLKTVWGSNCVDDVRAEKDEEEIALMKKASEINDVVMERVAEYKIGRASCRERV